MSDIFEQKNLKPMLFSELREAFDDPEYYFELKLDGIRCLAYLDRTETELRNKRNMRVSPTYPELSAINKQIKKRCILDGELLVMRAGRPDFFALQRRAMMTNKPRIDLAAAQLPASYVAYDILYAVDQQVTERPLSERKSLLQEMIRENESISVSRYIPEKGTALYDLVVQQELEGVVGKHKDSKYYPGKTTKEWCKIKRLYDDDFVICGYIIKPGGSISLVLGQYAGNELIPKGHVSMGVSQHDLHKITGHPVSSCPFSASAPEDKSAIWISPDLVCTVQWMPRDNSGLNQAVYKGLRDDKPPSSCISTI